MITSCAKQKIMHLKMLTNHLLNINLTKALIWKPLGNYLNIDLPLFPFSQQRERITVKEGLPR